MTINEAITLVDRLKPNQYERDQKVKWLSKLDGMIFREVILTHEGYTTETFEGYDGTDLSIELLVPYPYDEDIYNYFLQAQIDKENGELVKYNQNISMYNGCYMTFTNWYNRTHVPLPLKSAFKI